LSSKYKGFWPREARQRGASGIADGEKSEGAASLSADDEPRDAAIDQRRSEPAAVGELPDDRIGDMFDSAVDQDQS